MRTVWRVRVTIAPMRPTAPTLVLFAALAASGCNAIFGLDEPGRPDGATGDDDAAVDGPGADARICAGGHDEDRDGNPDACDACPHLSSAGGLDPDFDGDGIGDPCDPNPGEADHLIAFYPLEGEDIGLLTLRGSWGYDSTGLRQFDASFSGDTLALFGGSYSGDLVVEAGVVVTATATNPAQGLALWFDVNTTPFPEPDGYQVAIHQPTPGAPVLELRSVSDGDRTVLDSGTAPGTFAASQSFRIRGEVRGPAITFGATNVVAGSGNFVTTTSTAHTGGRLGFSTNTTAATVEYVVVYGRGR